MPQVDTYTAGTVSLTNGSPVVNGAGTNWMSGSSTYSVLAGHIFVCGNFFSPVAAVSAAGQLTLATPYTGATASGLAYKIFRYTWVETAAVAGFLQSLMDRGTKTKPVSRWDIDSGAMTMTLRQDETGQPAIYVGGTGAADGSMVKAMQINRSSGYVTMPLPVIAAQVNMSYQGAAAQDCYQTIFNSIDGSGNLWFNIGGVTSNVDGTGSRRRSLYAADTHYFTGQVGIGTYTPRAVLHATGTIRSQAAYPGYEIYCNGGSTDQKIWDIVASSSGVLSIRAVNDAFSGAASAIDILRSGAGINTIYLGGTTIPMVDGVFSLGFTSNRFSTLYATTGAINTSDAALKDVRGEPTDAELNAWGRVRAKIYRFLDAIAAKGDGARHHSGWIAQEVSAAFEAEGLDPRQYALFCLDTITEKVKTLVPGKVPVFDEIEETSVEVEVLEGVPRQVSKTSTVREQRFEQVPVIGQDGQPLTEWRPAADGEVLRDGVRGCLVPVTHPVPVMEDGEVEQVTESEPYERLGLRYDECLVMEAAWGRRELTRVQDSIAALTARVAALEPVAA